MNIFTLSLTHSPQESARFHCDQHLHKMILESAQMLSTAFFHKGIQSPYLYKPAYPKHPCTLWTIRDPANAYWLCKLATELEVIRQELNHPFHSSSDVIKFCLDYLEEDWPNIFNVNPSSYVFAGPAFLALNQTLSVPQKYQAYYLKKAQAWLDKGQRMSYKDRPIPSFMQEIIKP